MKHLAFILLGGILFAAAPDSTAQTELPSAPSAGKQTPAAQQSQAPAAKPQAQTTAPIVPGDPADSIPPDTAAPPPTKKAPDSGSTSPSSPAGAKADDQPPIDANSPRFVVGVPEVNVVFTVTDKRGKFIRDLQKENFSVTDTKQRVPEIRHFSSQTDLPLRVGLLIDASNSIRDRFKFEQEAAVEFLNQIVRPKEDQAFILGFDTTPEITQDWTNSTEKLSAGVRLIRPGGGTAFYDALYYACRDKLMKRKDPGSVRKAIIVLSDGDDNQSRVTLNEAIDMAQRAEVIVYTISTNLAPNSDRGDRVLQQISDATGGRTFHPFKIQDVANAFTEIQEELRSQYVIVYRPPNLVADGSYHPIEIQLANGKKYKVRARKGYFAPRE